jgi:hypothetical protein
MALSEFSTSCDGGLDVSARCTRSGCRTVPQAKENCHYHKDDKVKCEASCVVLFQLNYFGWKDRTSNKGIQ